MKGNCPKISLKVSSTAYGLYLLFTIILGICIADYKDSILLVCSNRPRYMQFAWIVILGGITVWKTIGYYILRKAKAAVLLIFNLLIDTILFIQQYKVLDAMELPLSLSLITLILLGIIAAVQLNEGIKKLYKIAVVIAYIFAGGAYMFIFGNRVLWKNDYSVFSHIYMLVACLIMYYVLSGKSLEVAPEFIRRLWEKLTLDD